MKKSCVSVLMENQSAHPQHGMVDQGFRPFTTTPLGSSVNAAPIMMPILAPIQMPAFPSNSADDGYIWKNLGLAEITDSGPLISYECSQEDCTAKKSVTLSADGKISEIVYKGGHNHPRPSEMCPRGVPTGYIPDSQYHSYVPSEMYIPGTSIPQTEEGGEQEQLCSSSDSIEEDDDEQRADGHFASASATKRHVVPAERRTRSRTSHRKRPKSKVWEEFTKVFRDGKLQAAVCKHCESSLSAKTTGGTSHLKRHLQSCPGRPATSRVQLQQPSSHPNSSVEKNSNLDQNKSLEFLTKALVSNLCSFSLTSSTNYRQFLAGICPTYDVVSQSAIQEKFLSIFQNEKLKLQEEIALAPGGVFLTAASSSLETKNFIFLTVQFIDKEWNLNRKIIRCCFMRCDDLFDTEYYVSMFPNLESYNKFFYGNERAPEEEVVKEVVQNWRLEWKLLGISSPMSLGDAAVLEKNLTGQNYLLAKCKLLHLPCIIDALNDLCGYEIKDYVLRTSQMWFQYMTCTPLRRDKYKEILSRLQISRPSFGSRRWYLTFHTLEAALQFNNEMPNPQLMDSRSSTAMPSFAQLKAAENFCDLVRSIYHAVKVVSRTRNGTLNSQFHAIWNLKMALLHSSTKENIDQVFNIEQMKLKFDQLWTKWYIWLSLAVVLDPRYKIRFLVVCFKEAFGSHAKRYISEVRGKLYDLFFQYSCHVDRQNDESFDQRTNDLQLDTHGSIPVHDVSQNYIEQAAHEELGEVIRYLEGELIPRNANFDILKWWKENASTYPVLARLARDILAIPGSAVSAESAFDEADERASLFNRKLSPELVEALICTQDWIKSSEIISDEVGGNINMPA